MATRYVLPIIKGPGKWELILALFEGEPVTFWFESCPAIEYLRKDFPDLKLPFDIIITSVEREDGTKESWNFKGFLLNKGCVKFDGYFSTRTRHGSAELVSK